METTHQHHNKTNTQSAADVASQHQSESMGINLSPLLVAQRKRIQTVFGNAQPTGMVIQATFQGNHAELNKLQAYLAMRDFSSEVEEELWLTVPQKYDNFEAALKNMDAEIRLARIKVGELVDSDTKTTTASSGMGRMVPMDTGASVSADRKAPPPLFNEREWFEAKESKRVSAIGVGYAKLAEFVAGCKRQAESSIPDANCAGYMKAIAAWQPASLKKYNKLRDLVKNGYNNIPVAAKVSNARANQQILDIFSWLIPLHDGTAKGIANKQGFMASAKSTLSQLIGTLAAAAGRGQGAPLKPLLKIAPATTIQGHQVGTQSEIRTSRAGALFSGEASVGRQLETDLSRMARVPFVAGHLVADSLGGILVNGNLTPITNTFNTTAGTKGIKDPENDGLRRTKAGQVIHYATTVAYGNRARTDLFATVPTAMTIKVSTLNLKSGGNPTNIKDYTTASNVKPYNLTMDFKPPSASSATTDTS